MKNWQLILQGVDSMIDCYDDDFICLAAIAPSLSLDKFQGSILAYDWIVQEKELFNQMLDDSHALYFRKQKAQLILTQNAYSQSLNSCHIALAMAGTATEQFVGLGFCLRAGIGFGCLLNRSQARINLPG